MIRSETVVVRGLDKFVSYMDHVDERMGHVVREEVEKAAEPVRDEARRLFERHSVKSAAGYAITSDRKGTVEVFQSLKPTTGLHPEWGALQMREALLPALDRKSSEVAERMNEAIGHTIVERF